jgi:hypothetical protein
VLGRHNDVGRERQEQREWEKETEEGRYEGSEDGRGRKRGKERGSARQREGGGENGHVRKHCGMLTKSYFMDKQSKLLHIVFYGIYCLLRQTNSWFGCANYIYLVCSEPRLVLIIMQSDQNLCE